MAPARRPARCGKQWPAPLCAPEAMHECTRPPDHPDRCHCACGAIAPAPDSLTPDGR